MLSIRLESIKTLPFENQVRNINNSSNLNWIFILDDKGVFPKIEHAEIGNQPALYSSTFYIYILHLSFVLKFK